MFVLAAGSPPGLLPEPGIYFWTVNFAVVLAVVEPEVPVKVSV